MRPGSTGARVWWVINLAVGIAMIALAWSLIFPDRPHHSTWFAVVWTALVVVITAVNFRTLWIGTGRRADAMNRALDERGQHQDPP